MAGNTFGKILQFSTWGESHGAAIGGVFSLVGKPAAAITKYGIAKPVGFGLRYGVGPVFQGASYLLSKDKFIFQ